MSEVSLHERLVSYEMLFKHREEFCRERGVLASKMFEFYAMLTAFQLYACASLLEEGMIQDVGRVASAGRSVTAEKLPGVEVIRGAGKTLLSAAASCDKTAMSIALGEMGVLELCPMLTVQFARMETFLESFTGRARLVLLIELANLAFEFGEYQRAERYVQEVSCGDAGSWERYNVATFQGLIALNAGEVHAAIQCLARSMVICLSDEYSSLDCGIRSPNLALAQGLLARGERVEVVRHLLQCKDVWQFLRNELDSWIATIESGKMPDLHASAGLRSVDQPSSRLISQWVLAAYPEEPVPKAPRSPEAIAAARAQLCEDLRDLIDTSLEQRLGLDDPRRDEGD